MWPKIFKNEWLWLGIILGVGCFLRLYALDYYPAGLHGDEAWTGIEAVRILRDGFVGFWSTSSYGNPALIYYFTAALFSLFGVSTAVLRLSLALPNIFWLPFFYLVVKRLTNRPVGLISTWLLSTGFAALAFSRKAELLALNFAFFPCIYFCLRARQTNKFLDWTLAGLFGGLALHTNQPFWLTPIFMLMFFALAFLRSHRTWRGVIWGSTVFVFIAWPILQLVASPSQPVFNRFKSIIVFSPESKNQSLYRAQPLPLPKSLLYTLENFVNRSDSDVRDYFYHGPVIDIYSRWLAVSGLVLSLVWARKRPQVLWLTLFFVAFLSGSVLTVDAPNARRMQPSVYISYAYMGIAVYAVWLGIYHWHKNLGRVAGTIGLALLLALGFYNAHIFFVSSRSKDAKSIMAYQLTEVASYVGQMHPDYVYFFSARWAYDYETLRFLLSDFPGENRSREFGSHTLEVSTTGTILYVFLPEYRSDLAQVQALYPGGYAQEVTDDDGSLLFLLYRIKI